jgi:pentatricopeptide repeat protein
LQQQQQQQQEKQQVPPQLILSSLDKVSQDLDSSDVQPGTTNAWKNTDENAVENQHDIQENPILAKSPSKVSAITATSRVKLKRENIHFEAVLVACGKLGLWKEALFIYNEMLSLSHGGSSLPYSDIQRREAITIHEHTIMSVVKACIRGMKHDFKKNNGETRIHEQRVPLDSARDILLSMKHRYNLLPSPILVNSLASAYQYMSLHADAQELLNLLDMPNVKTREQMPEKNLMMNTAAMFLTVGITSEEALKGSTTASTGIAKGTTSTQCKNEASYDILIKNSIIQGNWSTAIKGLQEMTEVGFFPKSKSLNAWSEAATKRERRPKKPTWVKQRERILMKNAPFNNEMKYPSKTLT